MNAKLHTRITLEQTATDFLFAAENNLPNMIAAMTDELDAARRQCEAITGLEWYEFVNNIQDKIHGYNH